MALPIKNEITFCLFPFFNKAVKAVSSARGIRHQAVRQVAGSVCGRLLESCPPFAGMQTRAYTLDSEKTRRAAA